MGEHLANEGQPVTVASSIGWALLGLLIERPSYGYELLQRFQRIYGDLLPLTSVARVYNAIEALRDRTLIEETPESIKEAAFTRQPKHHYRATPEGVRAYEEWLVARATDERRRSRLFARQLAMLKPEDALDVIERYERENLDGTSSVSPSSAQAGGIAQRLTDEDERLALGVKLSWIEYARRELKALIEDRDQGT
jgi:DNA-binding PadR family transcriptional regulator